MIATEEEYLEIPVKILLPVGVCPFCRYPREYHSPDCPRVEGEQQTQEK